MAKSKVPHPSETWPHPADEIYCEERLGALYTPEQTVFRVWAPTASRVMLHLYEAPSGGRARTLPMIHHRDGSWDVVVLGDWLGYYYTLTAEGRDPRFNPHCELIDPYARAVTTFNGRAIVIDDKTPVADRPAFHQSEAVIYEMHIRDFTIDPDSGIQRRGKYLGLTETGTHLTHRDDIVTGLDHLIELGVNVVQLMPIFDFHNDEANDRYGWGYDAVHFNAPEGWYATEHWDARRVSEVKRMIDALHRRGIRVTLDVVYNHTFESIRSHRIYSFEGLVPGYYYRLKPDGSYWNGSGVGNEFRTEAPMARRFVIDSMKYWVEEYKVDGFRIDLLGLIDRTTMERATRELLAIDAHLLIYGEPWTGGTTPIEVNGKGAQRGKGWSVFNDHFRDAIRGEVFDARDCGFIQSGVDAEWIKLGIRGSVDDFADSPIESVNYAECHDNHTLWDRLVISTIHDATVTHHDRRAMDKLSAALLFTSQGIPFIQCGQEFLRSKFGDHNSYDKPDAVNMVRWAQKAEHYDIYEYYRSLIALRRAHPLLRLRTAEEVLAAVKFLDNDLELAIPSGGLGFTIEDVTGEDEWARALVLLNTQGRAVEFQIPTGQWRIYGDGRRVGDRPLRRSAASVTEAFAVVPARSALILAEPR